MSPGLKFSLACLKKGICLLTAGAVIFLACHSNTNPVADTSQNELQEQFGGFLKAVKKLDTDSILAYTYPRYFEMITPDEARKSMEESYSFFIRHAKLEQVTGDSIYPVIHTEGGMYTKVVYSMAIRIPDDTAQKNPLPAWIEKDSSTHRTIGEHYAAPQSTLMTILLQESLPGVSVTSMKTENGETVIQMKMVAIAAKDSFASKWSFVSIIGDEKLLKRLFPEKVLELISKDNWTN